MNMEQRKRIEQHGLNLLAIFPNAAERDPIKLCRKLRRLERQAGAIGLRMCNGPQYDTEEGPEIETEAVLLKVDRLLDFTGSKVPVFVNQDPRGYALKINDQYVAANKLVIHRDWGGYGILAPEIE